MTHRASLTPEEQRRIKPHLRFSCGLKYVLRDGWARRTFGVCHKTLERASQGQNLNPEALAKIRQGLLEIDSKQTIAA